MFKPFLYESKSMIYRRRDNMYQLSNFCFLKGTVKRIKRYAQTETMFTNNVPDKRLYSEYINISQNSIIRRQNST